MSFYVDVILPIPVNQKFTYLISEEEYHFIKPGMRIIVPFGKSKLYTSVSYKTHNDDHNDSDFEFKSIIQIIDDFPIVNSFQLKFWDWVSRYYFTSIGEVMRASIPSNLILQSETILTLNNENEIKNLNKFLDDLSKRAILLDGTCTGEHGIGQGKKQYLVEELGGSVDFMKNIKKALDPFNIMNPGKIF